MPVILKNPISIVKVEEIVGGTDSSVKITNYTNGVIVGENLGSTEGYVYLLDRDTHSYSSLPVASWSNTHIELVNPIDTSVIEGNTCFFVQTDDGRNSNKYMIYGDIEVEGWGIVYVRDNDENITKMYMTNNQLSNLVGQASHYGKNITINNTTINTANIVGIQFGEAVSNFGIPTYFLASMPNLNQPVVLVMGMTTSTNSTYFMRYDYSFDCPLIMNNNITRFGNYFMQYCYGFNQPLDISMWKYLNMTYFMHYCSAFNNELKLPTSLTIKTMGQYFLAYCQSFNQPLKFPDDMTSFGQYFMSYDHAFNQPFNIPNTISSIGTYFLNQCYAFNQPIDLSKTAINSLGANFMSNCRSFNSKLTLRNTIASTPTNFMTYCQSFNQPLDISNIKTFGNYFMSYCYAFNQPLDINPSAISIGTYFLAGCYAFSKHLTIPSTITGLGSYFMYEHYVPFRLTVNCYPMTSANATYALAQSTLNCGSYEQGITIDGTYKDDWLDRLPNSSSQPYRNLIDGGN